MTYLNPLKSCTSETVTSAQNAVIITSSQKMIPKLKNICVLSLLKGHENSSISERAVYIQGFRFPTDLEIFFYQEMIRPQFQLEEAENIEIVLKVFNEIEAILLVKKEDKDHVIRDYFESVIVTASEVNPRFLVIKTFQMLSQQFSQRTFIQKMIGLFYDVIMQDQSDLDWFCKSQSFITTLTLSPGFKIGDEYVRTLAQALAENISLLDLGCASNQIGDEGAKAIAEALTKNKVLISLNIGNNKIGDEGAKALAAALTKNTMLKRLSIFRNNLGEEGVKALREVEQLVPGRKIDL